MFSVKAAISLLTLSASLVSAQQLTITEPSSERWWVAQSQNTLRWNCEQTTYTNWTVLITNSDATVLSGPLALIAIQYNYDCSKTMIPGEQLKPGTGYVMQFANTFNSTDVFASSEPFEVKAVGSTYPPQITTTGTPGTTATGTEAAGASGTTSATASTPSNGALANAAGLIFIGAAALGAMGLVL